MTELRDPAEVFAAEIGWQPALERTDLLAEPVAAALRALEAASPEAADLARQAQVVPIDPSHSDTDALNAHYDLDPEATGNCVLVAGKRTGEERIAACVVRATDFADVNHVVKKRIDVRKASFLPVERAVKMSGMEYGGITRSACPRTGASSSTALWRSGPRCSSARACATPSSWCPGRCWWRCRGPSASRTWRHAPPERICLTVQAGPVLRLSAQGVQDDVESLAHGGVGDDGVAHLLPRQVAQHRHLDAGDDLAGLAGLGADDGGTQDEVGAGVDDDLEEALGAAQGLGARDGRRRVLATRTS